MRIVTLTFLALAASPLVPSALDAAELTLTATADVARPPDVVTLSGGVTTTALTASAAMAENSRAMAAVVAAVRNAGVAARDVQTQGLSLQPQYSYDARKQTLTGYMASNTVRLRLRDVAGAGPLLDTLVKAGANQISGPDFSLDKPDAALDQARRAAIATARARAVLYAEAAGLKVVRIEAISESGMETPQPRPMMRMATMEAGDAPPVAPGEVSMAVSVTVKFLLE